MQIGMCLAVWQGGGVEVKLLLYYYITGGGVGTREETDTELKVLGIIGQDATGVFI